MKRTAILRGLPISRLAVENGSPISRLAVTAQLAEDNTLSSWEPSHYHQCMKNSEGYHLFQSNPACEASFVRCVKRELDTPFQDTPKKGQI